ncbi:hypothetical protein MY10362_009434 [Beauveria mimosiformis]
MASSEATREPNQSTATEDSVEDFAQARSQHYVDPDRFPLSRNEILHVLRVMQEGDHHLHLSTYCAGKKWLLSSRMHQPVDLDHASTLHREEAGNACNRTAAVYLLRDEWCPRARSTKLFQGEEEISFIAAALFQYAYHRGFQPYKSEVDLGQFLTKVNIPSAATDLPVKTCSLAMVERLKRSHTNFCERVRDFMDNDTQPPRLFGGHRWPRHMRPFFYIQPVFEAVIVAVRTGEFDFATTDIADMRTLIIATGKEAKSGPIDLSLIDAADRLDSVFDNGRLVAVESRLEVILSFLLDLEQREHALGMQPDLPVCDMDDSVGWAMEHLGWDPAEPLHGPSSAWVDTDNHSTWTLTFTPGPRAIPLTHNCLGELMSSVTDTTPDYFANRGINHVRQLPSEFGGDEGFATFVSAIPADKKVLVDLTEDDRPECNHVESITGYSPFSTWGQRSRLRYSAKLCKVRTRAMPLREFLVDKDLKDVEFHASGGP